MSVSKLSNFTEGQLNPTEEQLQHAARRHVANALEFYPLRQPVHNLLVGMANCWIADVGTHFRLINVTDGAVIEEFGTLAAAFEALINIAKEKIA